MGQLAHPCSWPEHTPRSLWWTACDFVCAVTTCERFTGAQFEAEQEALFGGSFEDMCRQLEREEVEMASKQKR